MSDPSRASEPGRRRLGAVAAALANRCPDCGGGALTSGFLTPEPACAVCGRDFEAHAAGDGAAYIVMTAASFVVMGAVVALELAVRPPAWVHVGVGAALASAMTAVLSPLVKRFLIAQSITMDVGPSGPEGS